ncbi:MULTISPECIES: retron St85 family RNA-directed DNA polymerase [unclassified Bradyrhizobium]|uniref:retron St85 family RNA-directed DNA polymerase n=1 Tax=unclassified Bradyrhizobium TaxID=2631580 RepID=UPI0028E376B9|nr:MULTISPECIES: retron St85 family RNA-directed DNA polymerase [unclassified Bradyrhizobium]
MSLIRELVEEIGLSATAIQRIVLTAPARYKVYNIPKRHGMGSRTIAQPSRELKAIQHYILQKKLTKYKVHDSSMAYVRGRNIRQNAERHAQPSSILKLDFKDFFPSIKVADWERFARRTPILEVEQADIRLYSQIMFWGQQKRSTVPKCLSIGAPTSPALSNILLFDLDVMLNSEAGRIGVVYTRYADDITISAANIDSILSFERFVRRAVKSLKSPKLTFNDDKRGLFKKGQRRLVTGLVMTPNGQISVGRERKRLISSMLHRSLNELLDQKERSRLKGLLGFCIANEPDFLTRMRSKYGDSVIEAALKFHAPKRSELLQSP